MPHLVLHTHSAWPCHPPAAQPAPCRARRCTDLDHRLELANKLNKKAMMQAEQAEDGRREVAAQVGDQGGRLTKGPSLSVPLVPPCSTPFHSVSTLFPLWSSLSGERSGWSGEPSERLGRVRLGVQSVQSAARAGRLPDLKIWRGWEAWRLKLSSCLLQPGHGTLLACSRSRTGLGCSR